MQIVFTTDNRPGSWLIRKLTASRWHHVGVSFGETVFESRATGGVQKTTLGEFKSRGQFSSYEVPVPDEKGSLDWLHTQLGKPYDWSGVFGLALSRRWQKPERWYCSELAAAAAKAGGLDLVRRDITGVTPRDLWVLPYN